MSFWISLNPNFFETKRDRKWKIDGVENHDLNDYLK